MNLGKAPEEYRRIKESRLDKYVGKLARGVRGRRLRPGER